MARNLDHIIADPDGASESTFPVSVSQFRVCDPDPDMESPFYLGDSHVLAAVATTEALIVLREAWRNLGELDNDEKFVNMVMSDVTATIEHLQRWKETFRTVASVSPVARRNATAYDTIFQTDGNTK
jgi:hypothetical protein